MDAVLALPVVAFRDSSSTDGLVPLLVTDPVVSTVFFTAYTLIALVLPTR